MNEGNNEAINLFLGLNNSENTGNVENNSGIVDEKLKSREISSEEFLAAINSIEELLSYPEISDDYESPENKYRKNYFNDVIFAVYILVKYCKDSEINYLYEKLEGIGAEIQVAELSKEEQIKKFDLKVQEILEKVRDFKNE